MRKVIRKRIRHRAKGLDLALDLNADVAINSRQPGEGDAMTDQPGFKPLTREELNEMAGEELPERAAMSLVNANVAIPINAAVAANVLSDNAVAYADAAQNTPIDQSTGGG
jgi:hypothetical protein